MNKMLRVVEVMWAVIAAVSAYEAFRLWNIERQKSLIFIAFLALAIFMFFFRRRTRMRYENKHKNNGHDQ